LSRSAEQTVSSAPPAAGVGSELRIVMSLVKPELILIEDAMKLETEALMMTVSERYNTMTHY